MERYQNVKKKNKIYLSIFFPERMLIILCICIYLHKKKVLAIDKFSNAGKILKLEVKSIINREEHHLNTAARKNEFSVLQNIKSTKL